MTVPLEWIYLVITVPFAIVWCVLWLYAPQLRREQVRMSIVFAVIGVIAENWFYYQDYWNPQSILPVHFGSALIFPEALMFGGVFGGIASVVYRAVFGIREASRDFGNPLPRLFIAGGIFLFVSYTLFFLGVNSIYAHASGALALAIYIVFRRPDLRGASLASGVLMLSILFVCYSVVLMTVLNMEQFLASAWLLYDTPLDKRIAGIPITELVWGFSVGASISVIRAYVKGIRYTAPML